MTAEQKIKKSYSVKFALWLACTGALALIGYMYHSSPSTKSEPTVTAAVLMLISAALFPLFGLHKFIFDKAFSGTVVNMKIESKQEMPHALERRFKTFHYACMTVECDNGKIYYHEEQLKDDLVKVKVYQPGDRVYHIKGAKHTCLFPKDGDAHRRVSVICPLCGAHMKSSEAECSYCSNELPYDPAIK